MASRPVFRPDHTAAGFVREVDVEFKWHPGMATSQSQKNIRALHASAAELGIEPILEISSKSESALGQQLSAFNLTLRGKEKAYTVEQVFQGSKVFERGGPFKDFLDMTGRAIKKDPRLKESGDLIAFNFFDTEWPLEPKTAFYDWLYIRALGKNPDLAEQLMNYEGFTDIVFNPKKSFNCQARSAALYVVLSRLGRLDEAMRGRVEFLRLLGSEPKPRHLASPSPPTTLFDAAPEVSAEPRGGSVSNVSAKSNASVDPYRRHVVVDVDVAVIGVSRQRWVSASPDESEDAVRARMAEHRFDILPVDVPGQPLREYYRSQRWGHFENVIQGRVTSEETLPWRTPVRELVRRMADEPNRYFFFLTDDTSEVGGLVTVANLNCPQARTYAYSLLSELEATLAKFIIDQTLSGDSPLDEGTIASRSPDAAYGRYMKEKAEGMDRHLVEYLTLSNLAAVLKEADLFRVLGARSKSQLDDLLKPVIEIRHCIAHPVRSLVEHPEDVVQLWDALRTSQELLDILEEHRPWNPDAAPSQAQAYV